MMNKSYYFTIGRAALAWCALILSVALTACQMESGPQPPGQPTALTASYVDGNDNAIAISWTKPGGTLTGYRIESRTAPTKTALDSVQFAAQGADITDGNTTTTIITGFANGWWQFQITALNGNLVGAVSMLSNALILPPALLPPAALTITRPTGSDNAFTLTWSKPAGGLTPTGYRIESRTAATEAALDSVQFARQGTDITADGDTTTITFNALANGWWQFRVLALKDTTVGEPTTSSAVIASATTAAPNAPTGLATTSGTLRIELSWQPGNIDSDLSNAPLYYSVEVRSKAGGSFSGNFVALVTADNRYAGTRYSHENLDATLFYQYKVTAHNGVGSSAAVISVADDAPGAIAQPDADNDTVADADDVDDDNDGLIEIATLAQLNNMRYNLAGTSYDDEEADTGTGNDAGSSLGCPATGCRGYELVSHLDFADADGDGPESAPYDGDPTGPGNWLPIGKCHENTDRHPSTCGDGDDVAFGAIFQGNAYTITGMNIHSDALEIGFFAVINQGAYVRNIGLINNTATYTGAHAATNYLGGLVGYNYSGFIVAAYTTGSVNDLGSIVDCRASYFDFGVDCRGSHVGGLVGNNYGFIQSSYTTGAVTAGAGNIDRTGGLVGVNEGRITATYATGDVSGGEGGNDEVGGLVGNNLGNIIASYATGNADGGMGRHDYVGKLVGYNQFRIISSYGFGSASNGRIVGHSNGASTTMNGGVWESDVPSSTVTTAEALTLAIAGSQWNMAAWFTSTTTRSRSSATTYVSTKNAWDFRGTNQLPALRYADWNNNNPGGFSYQCAGFFPTTLPDGTPLVCNTTLIPDQPETTPAAQ